MKRAELSTAVTRAVPLALHHVHYISPECTTFETSTALHFRGCNLVNLAST
jgi:hypothetical protein